MNIVKKYWMSIRKRTRLTLNKRFFVKDTGNVKLLLDIVNRVDRHIDVSGCYEPDQVKYLSQLLIKNNCDFFCDVGAHWGYYSLLMASKTELSEMEIHAFEPDRINRYQLYANLFLNKLDKKINVHDFGASDYSGKAAFHNFHEGNRGRSHISDEGETLVEVRRLEDVLSFENKVVGIKIDVEGHECRAVTGMKALLTKNKCILQVESFNSEVAELTKQFETIGYKYIHGIEDDHYFSNIENILI